MEVMQSLSPRARQNEVYVLYLWLQSLPFSVTQPLSSRIIVGRFASCIRTLFGLIQVWFNSMGVFIIIRRAIVTHKWRWWITKTQNAAASTRIIVFRLIRCWAVLFFSHFYTVRMQRSQCKRSPRDVTLTPHPLRKNIAILIPPCLLDAFFAVLGSL